jgi:hypothetical protein
LDVGDNFGIEEYSLFQCISKISQNEIPRNFIFGPRVSRVPKIPAKY